MLSLQLASSQHRVTLAEGAEQALTLVEENYFDMVLTDCQMPVMNGYELTKVLRASSAQRTCRPKLFWGVLQMHLVQSYHCAWLRVWMVYWLNL
ncbi:response regulator [Arsenophonus apicola]|uniref:response regulator n=1 Tax=Arsenophonus apicola TaxID=2879119 RepID=UPI0021048991|nr:response regulator [Arsenophonus apicola]